jgi:hypothetical protein
MNYKSSNCLIGNAVESILKWYFKTSFVLYNHNDLNYSLHCPQVFNTLPTTFNCCLFNVILISLLGIF